MDAAKGKRERADAQDRLASILNTVVDGIVTINASGLVESFNSSAERIFGYAAAEAIGKNVKMLMPQPYEAEHDSYLRNYLSTGRAKVIGIGREVVGKRKDGTVFPMDLAVSQFQFEGQQYFTGIVRDISEQTGAQEAVRQTRVELERAHAELKAATQQLWQSAKLASVGELAASIAHELNNPLATVTLKLDSLLSRDLDAAVRHSLIIVQQETDRMANLVGNLLQFTRLGPEQQSSVDLAEELAKSLELVHHLFRKHQIEVRIHIDRALPVIFADRQKLRQVFLNLLSNACDAMASGGTLTLHAEESTVDERAAVAISFADTGVGIPPELLPKVMDPFFTTKDEGKGTGLGLAICRRIVVQEHAGRLTVDSAPGTGTIVRIVLPTRRSYD
ncbi:MAG: ATP-binding protein [Planctomycetota bacterium]